MCFPFVLNPNSHPPPPPKCHPATHVDASLATVVVDSGGVGCSQEGGREEPLCLPPYPPPPGSRLPGPGEGPAGLLARPGHRWPSVERPLPQDPNHRPPPRQLLFVLFLGRVLRPAPQIKAIPFLSLFPFLSFFLTPTPPQKRERQPQDPLRGRDITAQVTTAQPMSQGRGLAASCIL